MFHRRLHRLTAPLLILVALTVSTLAQRSEPSPQTDNTNELWRVRAQTVTDDLLKDAANLSTFRRAVLWVRLADLWWRDDPGRARTWLTNAIEAVEQVPNRESPQEREQRLATAKLLLQVAARLDQKLSKRLITVVSDVDESTSASERSSRADNLIYAAASAIDRDPKRAAELGSQALRLGTPSNISVLLFPLRAREPKLADTLFAEALSVARQKLDAGLLDSLTEVAFPKLKGVPGLMLVPPDTLKAELLGLHVAYANAHANELVNGNWFCFGVGAFIAPVLPEFDRLLPQQGVLVRQAVQKCRSIPTGRGQLNNPAATESLNTVEALLKAAADTDIIGTRTQYQYRAAHLAKDQRDYDQAVKILDNMSEESRALMGSTWDFARADWAAASALEHYENGRLVEMNSVLTAVPPRAQPSARMIFLHRLPNKPREGAPTVQFLNDVREGLRRAGIPDSEKYVLYFDLLHLTIRYQPADAGPVLKDAIAALNRGIPENSKFLDGTELSNAIPASLLDMDEFGLKEALASVTSVEARAQLRLQLLKNTLQRIQNRAR